MLMEVAPFWIRINTLTSSSVEECPFNNRNRGKKLSSRFFSLTKHRFLHLCFSIIGIYTFSTVPFFSYASNFARLIVCLPPHFSDVTCSTFKSNTRLKWSNCFPLLQNVKSGYYSERLDMTTRAPPPLLSSVPRDQGEAAAPQLGNTLRRVWHCGLPWTGGTPPTGGRTQHQQRRGRETTRGEGQAGWPQRRGHGFQG